MVLFCKDFGDLTKAKILVIGHDPRLQNSDTIAEYCFFADYHYKEVKTRSEKRKKGLADSAFAEIMALTCGKYKEDEIYFTNLCNEALPHTDRNTILIPEDKVDLGIKHLNELVDKGSFEYIFPTSLQVNYWLVKKGFYKCGDEFLKETRLSPTAVNAEKPYFAVTKSKTFKLICGNVYDLKGIKVIPILHPKNYPLNGRFKLTYQDSYNRIKGYFEQITV